MRSLLWFVLLSFFQWSSKKGKKMTTLLSFFLQTCLWIFCVDGNSFVINFGDADVAKPPPVAQSASQRSADLLASEIRSKVVAPQPQATVVVTATIPVEVDVDIDAPVKE